MKNKAMKSLVGTAEALPLFDVVGDPASFAVVWARALDKEANQLFDRVSEERPSHGLNRALRRHEKSVDNFHRFLDSHNLPH